MSVVITLALFVGFLVFGGAGIFGLYKEFIKCEEHQSLRFLGVKHDRILGLDQTAFAILIAGGCLLLAGFV